MTATHHHSKHDSNALIHRYRPLYDLCLTTHVARSNKRGLLYVPDDKREDIQYGNVIAVGAGVIGNKGQRLPLVVQAGDKVLWAKHWEHLIDLGRDQHYAAVREKDIIGIIAEVHGKEQLVPLWNTVVIDPNPVSDRAGSLYLPQKLAREREFKAKEPVTGTVISCGPGHRIDDGSVVPLIVKVGDRVLYECLGGEDHEFSGYDKPVRLIPEEHILAVL
jgi:chaperonin GroES